MNDDGKTSRATPGGVPLVATSPLQPLLDFLASKHASEDSEDTTFDDVAGSVLAEYAERRDELEERHERDDLVSSRTHTPAQQHYTHVILREF
jgi:hypothetical protein